MTQDLGVKWLPVSALLDPSEEVVKAAARGMWSEFDPAKPWRRLTSTTQIAICKEAKACLRAAAMKIAGRK